MRSRKLTDLVAGRGGLGDAEEARRQQANMAPFTPHDLRRTFAGDLLDAGTDLATVQKLMGHADTNTTVGYDRRGEQAKRSAVKKLHVPYQRRYGTSDSREIGRKSTGSGP